MPSKPKLKQTEKQQAITRHLEENIGIPPAEYARRLREAGFAPQMIGVWPPEYAAKVGVKHDKDKIQWALLPWRELRDVAQVMTLGTKKYAADNWMHVPVGERRYFEAAMRHIVARQGGEINDPETKLPHLSHAVCCLLFWMWFDHKKKRGHR